MFLTRMNFKRLTLALVSVGRIFFFKS